jgi:hypothetical protein
MGDGMTRVMDEPDLFQPPSGLRKLSVADCNAFWQAYCDLRPGLRLMRGNHWSRWRPVAGTDIFIALYLANRSVGMFVRGERGLSHAGTLRMLSVHEPRLSRALGVAVFEDGCPYLSKLPLTPVDRSQWPRAHRWLMEREESCHGTLAGIVGGVTP